MPLRPCNFFGRSVLRKQCSLLQAGGLRLWVLVLTHPWKVTREEEEKGEEEENEEEEVPPLALQSSSRLTLQEVEFSRDSRKDNLVSGLQCPEKEEKLSRKKDWLPCRGNLLL
jgi:hypothetical protein